MSLILREVALVAGRGRIPFAGHGRPGTGGGPRRSEGLSDRPPRDRRPQETAGSAGLYGGILRSTTRRTFCAATAAIAGWSGGSCRRFPVATPLGSRHRALVAGMGPAGLFAALRLAQLRPGGHSGRTGASRGGTGRGRAALLGRRRRSTRRAMSSSAKGARELSPTAS